MPFLAFYLFLVFLSAVADFVLFWELPFVATTGAGDAGDGSWARHNCNRELAAFQFAWISSRCRAAAASLGLFLG